ncbi:MAG: hypothetical protein KBG20_18515 [Caldilineaceae bacterium]|nr:hypothetical protein [Caldilineaceae bacterium]MBP8110284.1 hypothetical protein [Caldilineaceae bacterium]MBP8124327.1 hypothetical protein [Caldilineaceae bacterium]MBP9074307.1 hypothetical protein [Caldilineaceae bacterium]
MLKNDSVKTELPATFETLDEMANFWDTHDVTDFEEFLTPVDVTVALSPRHEYVITLSDSLDSLLQKVQKSEGVSLNTLVNLWVQEKLQQYAVASR